MSSAEVTRSVEGPASPRAGRWRRIGRTSGGILLMASAWACDTRSPEPGLLPDLKDQLVALLDSAFRDVDGVPGALLRVEDPARSLVWERALGTVDQGSGMPLRPDHTFRIASVTKTFVAAAVLRLGEDGRLGLDDPIGMHLLPATVRLLLAGGYDPSAITVRMALQHMGGFADYATADVFVARILSAPTHRWTRQEQLALAMELGGPVALPGVRFHYSDTGYILLGEIVEQVTELPLHAALRALLRFHGLGLAATWMEAVEPAPVGAPARAHQYFESLDTHDFDPSFDLYGGGGLVSNLRDVSTFFRALFEGRVFRRPETLDAMITATPASLLSSEVAGYGMGTAVLRYDGRECYGHGGFWGVLIRYCPAADLLVAGVVTSTSGVAMLDGLVGRAILFTMNRHRS